MALAWTKTKKYLYLAFLGGYGEELYNLMTTLTVRTGLVENAFLYDEDRPDTNQSICILCKRIQGMPDFLAYIRAHSSYIDDYEVGEDHHMLVVKIPSKHKKAYDNFLQSKYSKMYKKEFIIKIFKSDKPSRNEYEPFYVLMGDPVLRESKAEEWDVELAWLEELDSLLDLEKEVFKKEKLYAEI